MKNLFDESKLVKWGVNRIPIVPMTVSMPTKAKDNLAKGPLRLNHFIPKGLIRLNIGSNEGLARIVKIHLEDSDIIGAATKRLLQISTFFTASSRYISQSMESSFSSYSS